MFISAEKIARAIIKLLADSRISSNQWKFDISDHITNEHMGLVANAKNLADGINYQLDRKGLDIPEDLMIASRDSNIEYINNNAKVVRN